jgi:transposase
MLPQADACIPLDKKSKRKMAGKTKTMEQIRNILQQKLNGASIRTISKQTQASRNTVRTYLRLVEASGYSLQEAVSLSDELLGQLLFIEEKAPSSDKRYLALSQGLARYAKELKKRHVTRQILWEEYRQEFPDGYGYTRFCYHLNEHIGKKDVTAVFTHRPAEKLMVDFAGDKLSYIDRTTGEVIDCEVFIAVLPFSSYMYVEAVPNQKQEYFVKALSNVFAYLGGVPGCILCDNLKSAVKKANRYEPIFTELIDQLALHYQTTFMATRVRKPRDKATVETSVRVSYNRIYAKLRNQQAYSLAELDQQIKQELLLLNQRLFKGRDYSRAQQFSQYEQPLLKSLPSSDFEVKKTVMAKVQRNYHLILGEDRHQYSVPFEYARQQVKITYTSDWVEVYHHHKRIALHTRDQRKNGYSTLKEHMPQNHQAAYRQKGWDADYFLREAAKVGSNTRQAVAQILDSKIFPEQTYNSCLGVLRLAKKYGNDRMERACELMMEGPRINYGILESILKNNMDKKKTEQIELDFKTPAHDNIRGPKEFF